MTVPYTFANQVGTISLAELDANFSAVGVIANVAATVAGNAQPNITSVGTLVSLSVTGNVTGDYFAGNGAGLTGVIAVSNVGVATQLVNGTSSFNIPVANGNIYGNVAGTSNVYVFTNLGLDIGGYVSASGNIRGANLITTGNVTGVNIIGNGYRLTAINAANVFGNVANAIYANYSANSNQALIVTGNSQPNITTVGLLTGLSVTGNANITGTTGIIGNVGITGNVSIAGNINLSNNIAVGNITANGTVRGQTVSAVANVLAGNVFASQLTASNGMFFNATTVVGNVTINGYNASSTGPITTAPGAVIDIIDGNWVIS